MSSLQTDEIIQERTQNTNVYKYALRVIRRWPYILSFFLLSVLVGVAYNRYLTPIYAVKGRITTSKFSKNHPIIPGMVDASFFLNGLVEVYEEIPILRSPKRIEASLNKLDLRVSYFSKGLVKTVELSRGYGFDVEIDTIMSAAYPHSVPIFVNHVSATTFKLDIEHPNWKEELRGKIFHFNEPFTIGSASLRVINTNGKTAQQGKYYFILNQKSDLIKEYRNKLQINWAMKGSAMLDLYIQSELPERDLQFMNAYYEVVHEIGLEEKNETLDNTIRFIDEQMKIVNDSLNYYQSLIDGVKLENRKLPLGPNYVFTQLEELDKKRADIIMNERYFDYLIDYFEKKSDAEVFAPSLIGLNIPPLEGWVNQYIQQKLTQKQFRNNENAQNPLVNKEDSLRKKLIKGIYESVNSERERNQKLIKEINQQENTLYSSVSNVQSGSRNLGRLERMYAINSTLFDLFIKRRTEAAISKASATSDYKVIDEPAYSRAPIQPDKKQNLIIAATAGFLIPIIFFLFRDITNSTILDKDDLQRHTNIPLLGNIAHSDYDTNLVVADHPRSVVAESFRSVRSNLKFLTTNIDQKSYVFLITSSVGGEGKTFCSLNLACSLALSQKKTIMIGADLRKPELANYLNIPSTKGLSAYLAGYASLDELIIHNEDGQPDVIDAGKIPPNPSELLGNERMAEMIRYLKQHYQYIIIDTPPIGLVSDAMELFKFSDYNILIVRQEVTPKGALKMVNELYIEGKLRNFTVLFNDLELIKKRSSYYSGYLYGMGYSGYGFGYYEEDSKKNKT